MEIRTSDPRVQRTVLIVDDSRTAQAVLDDAFNKREDFRVVGFSSDARVAGEMIRRLMPDIVTIDLCMPYLDGAALLDLIGDLNTVCKIIVSDQPSKNERLSSRLIEAGAATCLSKSELIGDPAAFFKKVNASANFMSGSSGHSVSTLNVTESTDPDGGASVNAAAKPLAPIPADELARRRFLRRKGLADLQPRTSVRCHNPACCEDHGVPDLPAHVHRCGHTVDQIVVWTRSAQHAARSGIM